MDAYSGKFKLICKDDWPKLPAMRWQVKDLVPLHGVTLLFGQPKIGKKSFIAISLACAVAAGHDWCGHETQKGKVLYVVGEGFYGILRRQAAWEALHGCSAEVRYLRAPVNFSNADDVKAALKALKAQDFEPDFIVIDTLARSMSGAKENAAEDMSRVFELLEAFRTALNDASILLVHHTTKDGLNYRGSSVIPAAVDGLIESKANGLNVSLISAGFKDVPEFDPFEVTCEPTLVDTEDGWQNVLAVKEMVANTIVTPADADERNAHKLVEIIAHHFPKGGTFTELHQHFDMGKTTFWSALKYAEAQGWIAGGGGRGQVYRIQPGSSGNGSALSSEFGSVGSPLRGSEPTEPIGTGSFEPITNLSEPTNQARVVKPPTQPPRSESPMKSRKAKKQWSGDEVTLAPEPAVNYVELDAFAEAMEQLAARPSRRPGAR